MNNFTQTYDVIVIGGGNAGFTAATTAAHSNSSVLLVEKAPQSENGGNTFYTAGAYRYCFDGLSDLKPILYQDDGSKGLPQDLLDKVEMSPYTREDFMGDLMRVTKGRCDPALARILVERSRDAVQWIAENGGKWHLSFHRQAYEVDGKFKFWGGMVTAFLGGGKALVDWHVKLAGRSGVEIAWGCPAVQLLEDEASGRIMGVEVLRDGRKEKIRARGGVVLASGGFQADPALRAQWLGPGWDLAHVRGCCHSTCWDRHSPRNGGNRELTNQYTKSGYPLGLMLNLDGKRFVDEGFDLRNYTYAIFGAEILKQPSGVVFQVWDAEGSKWLRKEEYADDVTDNIRAESLDALADQLWDRGLKSKQQFLDTITEYNEAAVSFQAENPEIKFNPTLKDGLSTQSSKKKLSLAKSNWATELKKPPFTAVEVTSGVTFTFGGLDIVPDTAQVVSDATRQPIEGLYCCGELIGGLFYTNYPGGSGLTAGTVFGRIAGAHAAEAARSGKFAMANGHSESSGIVT